MGTTKHKGVGQGVGGGRPKFWTADKIEVLAEELLVWINQPQNFWLMDFANERMLWAQRLDELASESEKFSVALKIAKERQTTKIMKLAAAGKFNPAMAIFTLKNVSRWTDKVDVNAEPGTTVINVITNHTPPVTGLPAPAKNGAVTHTNGNGKHNGKGSDVISDAQTDPSEDDA